MKSKDDAVPVTAEDRKALDAALAAIEADDDCRGRGRFEALQIIARHRGSAGVGEPVAYLHTLHMEHGQTYDRLTVFNGIDPDDARVTAFGIPGRDYSEEYSVSTTPLYALASLTQTPATPMVQEGLREALANELDAFVLVRTNDPALAIEVGNKVRAALSATPAQEGEG